MSSLVLFVLVLLACGEVPTVTPVPRAQPTAVAVVPTPAWPDDAQPLVDLAIAYLAKESEAKSADIEVVRVEAVDWPDGCLGCAKKGEMCTMAIVPGYRIVLTLAGQEYELRTDKSQGVRACPSTSNAGDFGAAQALLDKAVADLAERLGIAKDGVKVGRVQERAWPDSSLGCPKEGMAYLTVITPGYQFLLEAAGQQYDYRADSRQGTVTLCERQQQ
jgi:hypothetical protein